MIEEFNNIAQSIFCEDFVCFSETWLKSVECTEYYVEHYHCINKPRSFHHKRAKRGAGGILLYINNRIWSNIAVLSNMTADNRVWIKLYDTSTEDNDIYISFSTCPLEIQVLHATINQNGHILNQKSLICQQEVIFSFVETLMLGLGQNVTILIMMLNLLYLILSIMEHLDNLRM